ncbi:MAG: SigF/SigG family RNA polymerase sporulation sigma factor [Lachnospiraceae bacterium]|nr:SigF/SigG family RNA polymerase sporulation sigma factor [Lachnospiraceae bacterium]
MENTLELINRAQNGDAEAREQLVEGNVGLIWNVVRRFSNRGQDPEDLFQIGCIGLLKAIDRFDGRFEVRFSTYAVPMIMGEIKRFLRDDGMLKVSRTLKEIASRARAMEADYQNRFGKDPTMEEIAAALMITREELAEALSSSAEVESLQKTIYQSDGDAILLMDKLENEENEQERMLNHMALTSVMKQLQPQEQKIITLRYYYERTQTQTAMTMGISQVQVSRLEKKVLMKMRELMS